MVRKFSISLGLVNIPVQLHNTAKEQKVSFNQITPCCGARVSQSQRCKSCGKEVSRAELQKGYEITKDNYVTLTQAQVNAVKLPSAKSIVIEAFIPTERLDPMLFSANYYLSPYDGGEKPYSLLAEVLKTVGKVAIGKMVMNGKEHVVAIRFWKKWLVLNDLWYPAELLKPPEVELLQLTERELELARRLIETFGDVMDLRQFKDQYVEALQELVRAKSEGKEITQIAEVKATGGADLSTALEQSLEMKRKKVAIEVEAR